MAETGLGVSAPTVCCCPHGLYLVMKVPNLFQFKTGTSDVDLNSSSTNLHGSGNGINPLLHVSCRETQIPAKE